ncbi:unnamed protein product, partial [Ascophyllum nodosum]
MAFQKAEEAIKGTRDAHERKARKQGGTTPAVSSRWMGADRAMASCPALAIPRSTRASANSVSWQGRHENSAFCSRIALRLLLTSKATTSASVGYQRMPCARPSSMVRTSSALPAWSSSSTTSSTTSRISLSRTTSRNGLRIVCAVCMSSSSDGMT